LQISGPTNYQHVQSGADLKESEGSVEIAVCRTGSENPEPKPAEPMKKTSSVMEIAHSGSHHHKEKDKEKETHHKEKDKDKDKDKSKDDKKRQKEAEKRKKTKLPLMCDDIG
jgi:hypothetical protein